MEPPSGLPVTLKTFATSTEATGYLEHEGFTFQGAPGRWLHIEENGPVYARIVALVHGDRVPRRGVRAPVPGQARREA
jgi:hypothetical protein